MESFGILAHCLAMLPFATCMLSIFSQRKKNMMKQWNMTHHNNLSRRQTLRTSSPWLTRLLSLVYLFIVLVHCMFLWLYRMYTGHFDAFCDSSHQVHTLWRCLLEQMWTLGRVSLIESLALITSPGKVGCTHTHTNIHAYNYNRIFGFYRCTASASWYLLPLVYSLRTAVLRGCFWTVFKFSVNRFLHLGSIDLASNICIY